MRPPFEADSPENKPETAPSARETPENRDPSYPDRARIDSDVRAFLRPVSSPWIVFDRDSRVDADFAKSALRIGAIFASSPSLLPEPRQIDEAMASSEMRVAETKPQPMFPQTQINEAPVTEPSNVVVAKDVEAAELAAAAAPHPRTPIESDPFAVPGLVPNRKRPLMIAGGVVGTLAVATIVALSMGAGRHHVKQQQQAPMANAIVQAPAAAAAAAAPPPVAEPAAPLPAAAVPTPEPASSSAIVEIDQPAAAASARAAKTPGEVEGENAKDPKKRFGKLTIKGDAAKAGKLVWFDGKRMIGVGQRNYLVFCGMHTVAVSDKTDTKDVEVPCNGELVVSK